MRLAKVEALSVGRSFAEFCSAGGSASVHSVFEKAVNLHTDEGLLTIASKEIGKSSSSLTISNVNELNLSINESCSCLPGCVYFHHTEIDFSHTPVWLGHINRSYKKRFLRENLCIFKALLDRRAAGGSAWHAMREGRQSDSRLCGIKCLPYNTEDAVRRLIGFGPGLTPSGDDLILGFTAAANHFTEDNGFLSRLHGAITSALGATTDLSAQFLRNAMQCEYHEYIEDMLIALCDIPETVIPAAAKLINIGATSGSDIAAGMYIFFRNEVIDCRELYW